MSIRLESVDRADRAPTAVPAEFATMRVGEEMVRLYRQIDALLPDKDRAAIQFISSRKCEGTSTVARELSLAAATRFGRRVLLELQTGVPEISVDRPTVDREPAQVGDTTLYIAALPHRLSVASHSTAATEAAIWVQLRRNYDLIVIDSTPAGSSAGLALVSQVDGVVLVVEAEATRWPVAARARESIERSGGRVLGVVLNKRRFYIPAFLYNWL